MAKKMFDNDDVDEVLVIFTQALRYHVLWRIAQLGGNMTSKGWAKVKKQG
jgi:hypothetical protein